MTLSRGPYSELDKMSLFQDLKLKRRKVDSRCSSDGESIADTSTSSPDLLQPLSPKMCDQQQQQQQQQSAHQTPKSASLAVSDDGMQKEAPEALTSPPTTPSTADDEHEQQVCTSGSFDTATNNDIGDSSGAASSERYAINTSSNSYHSNHLNGIEMKDGSARSHHQRDECISVSYQDDDSDPADDGSMATSSAKPSMSGLDNGTLANAANFKDDAYDGSHRASPECAAPEATARNGGRGNGATNVTAASVIRSVADERRPRSVNPPTSSITTATTIKEQQTSSGSSGSGSSNALNANKCERLDSTASINIQTSHNTNNNSCAATTTITTSSTTTTACTSDAGVCGIALNATLPPHQYQHYGKNNCAGGVDDD
uniref:Uncharacterized protein n=1 Tax=Anopheles maculatus TaxID=74869 RepID=A0A182T180_9DIPT